MAIINTAYVAELSRALDIRLIDWCCNVSMVPVQFQSMERKNYRLKYVILTLFG